MRLPVNHCFCFFIWAIIVCWSLPRNKSKKKRYAPHKSVFFAAVRRRRRKNRMTLCEILATTRIGLTMNAISVIGGCVQNQHTVHSKRNQMKRKRCEKIENKTCSFQHDGKCVFLFFVHLSLRFTNNTRTMSVVEPLRLNALEISRAPSLIVDLLRLRGS